MARFPAGAARVHLADIRTAATGRFTWLVRESLEGRTCNFDPGSHRVQATAIEGQQATRTVHLEEGTRRFVVFHFTTSAPRAEQPPPQPEAVTPVARQSAARPAGTQEVAPLAETPGEKRERVDAYDALRIVSTADFIVGALGVGSGAWLIYSGNPGQAESATLSAYAGPAEVGILAEF